jgi:protein-S-isoprenylcysteine O-methyltransferase Ste14
MTAAIGLGIQIASVLFYFWGRLHLGRMWSGAIRIVNDHQLIESGPYRLLRHPMYTGMLGMCVGTAIVSGQYHALIGLALVTYAYVRKIRMEERVLREEFGEAYESYRRRTSALVPWVI